MKIPMLSSIPPFIHNMTIAKGLLSLTIATASAFLCFLVWHNADDFNTLTTPKNKSTYVECAIQQAPHRCVFNTSVGKVSLSADHNIESLQPFTLSLSLKNSRVTSAKIRFEGFEDYMGINQFRFKASENKHWQTRGSIPLCTTKSKTWRVIVSLYTNNQYSSYWFKIKTL